MATAIAVHDLRKRYGDFEALKGVSFEVAQGEIFALLGANGAGKTTTMEILTGFRRPDGGSVRALGLDPARDLARLRRHTGVMLQEAGFFPDLTVAQTVRTWQTFLTAPRRDVLEVTGLEGKADTKVRQLSGGEKRRLDLALALLGRPRVLFLDEPTAGMDPQARRATWNLIGELSAEGTTVLLTTHYLEEAQRLAASLAILNGGTVVASGSMAGTLAGRGGRVCFEPPDGAPLDELPLPAVLDENGRVVCRTADPDLAAQTLLGWAAERGVPLRGLEVRSATLEELFLDLAEEGTR